MNYEYSENILVQESAGNLLHDELGWDVIFAFDKEVLGPDGTLGRTSYKEILLKRYVRKALQKFNPWISDLQIDEAIAKLEAHLSSSTALQINEEKYTLIRDGVPVSYKDEITGEIKDRKAQLIDFNHPLDNEFLAVKELKIHGDIYRRRSDIIGFVNGIPLLFVELKKNTVDVEDAYNNNYRDYQDTIPHLFYYNAFVMLSNGEEAKVGTLGSKYKFFGDWKRLKETDPGSVELATMLRGICKKENFLDLFENFILFDHSNGHTAKILARNHQYLGVNEAIQSYAARKLNNGKLGVFWHTQGSGKSYSMLFFAQKIRRKFDGSPTIVVLTDREELNKQIAGTFLNCGLLGKAKATEFIAKSGDDLVERLKGNPSFIFTLIQKFNKQGLTPITPDHDIIVMSDEAHRSQYGIFAENMTQLLPTASRIGFTGTPLLSDDKITERTFGGYVSIYDFKRAVDDHATVPLYYENRGEKLKEITNPEINQKILDAIEEADLSPEKEEQLMQDFEKEIHLLMAEPRLDIIAKDFVNHYTDIWNSGKAMFVCLNKVTCVRMFNLVQKYWSVAIADLEKQVNTCESLQEQQELMHKLEWMKQTEMCVVISQEQNEIQTFNKWGLDIKPHRKKMEERELDSEFKDADNPFRIVFVCAMWLTGFDVPSLSCLYLDKPLKAHTLMQTIARANRVADGKDNGLIIDYMGVVKALREALAAYTGQPGGDGGDEPTVDKNKLLSKIAQTLFEARNLLSARGYNLDQLIEAKDFDKLKNIQIAANLVIAPQETKKVFQTYASQLVSMFKYVERDDVTQAQRDEKNAIVAIANELKSKKHTNDYTDLMVKINQIVNEYVVVEEGVNTSDRTFDISKIDFDILQKEFAKIAPKRLVLKDLDDVVKQRIERMMKVNEHRADFFKRYLDIIKDYNENLDSVTIEKIFEELMKLSQELDQEERRFVAEGFESDEELSIYELLFKDNLSTRDVNKIKSIASDLLKKIKARINELDHWEDKEETRAKIDVLIRDYLWSEMPESYSEESLNLYRAKIYDYVYTRYPLAA